MNPVQIVRRLAAQTCPLDEDGCCALCGTAMPPVRGDWRAGEELRADPAWHADGCPWAEAVLWDAYHPETPQPEKS